VQRIYNKWRDKDTAPRQAGMRMFRRKPTGAKANNPHLSSTMSRWKKLKDHLSK
jgi:hypothetical protein